MAFFANMRKKLVDKETKKATKNMPKKVAAIVGNVISAFATIFTMLPMILIGSVIVVVVTAFDWIIEFKTAKANTKEVYSTLGMKEEADITDVIQIKQNSDGEYYLDFADDFAEKIEKYFEKTNNQSGYHNMPENVEFFKKIIQADVCMKFPNLGGKVPEDSSGFQGVIDVRRATPDKDIGKLENTGQGETQNIEGETIDDPVEVSEYEDIVKEWKKGEKLTLTNGAIVYKERKSEIHEGEGTGVFDIQYRDDSEKKVTISKGETVTYTGNYKSTTNSLTKVVTTYIEVTYKDEEGKEIKGYIKVANVISSGSLVTSEESEHEVTKVANAFQVTSRAKSKTIGKADKTYTVAIAAGHNNTDNTGASANGLVEQDLTVEVAEKVEEILKDYSNIKVVQTGSTSSDRGGVKLRFRRLMARNANPDLCIQIHFNAGGGTGAEAIYKKGDNISQKLAEVLSRTISESMGIKNRGDGSDIEKCGGRNLSIIENSATSGFPSVVTEGAFLDGNPDADIIKNQNGIEKYAQGIVNGIDEYFQNHGKGHSSENTTATNVNSETVTSSIKSVVKNLKYKPLEEFKQLVSNGDKDALEYFTLDEEKKLVTATWHVEDGKTIIEENPPVDLTTSLQQYHVPFEYLLFFYIDTNYEDFSTALADKILKSEIVMAVQDNITTTKEVVTTQVKTEASNSEYSSDWNNSGSQTTITEEVSTSVGITYVDTWCVKTYNENSYSSDALGIGKKDKITVNIEGTVNQTNTDSLSDTQMTGSGTGVTGEKDEEGNDITYTYTNYQRTQTNTDTISNNYESGDTKTEGKENTFVKLYQKHKMHKKVRTDGYLFTIIENNEKTANLLTLTKYLIYKATDIDYGVVEYDFGEMELEGFEDSESSASYISGNALLEYLKAWEGHEGLSPNKKKYKIGLVKGNRTVGYGIDLETSGFEPRFKKAGYSTNVGDYVDVEFVDNLTKEEIENARKRVISLTSSCKPPLNEQQLDALAVITYQYGNIGNFVEMYKKYGNTEELRNHCQAYKSGGGLNPNGYYFTTKIGGNPEGNGRCDANWKLFHEGIYTDPSGKEMKFTTSLSGGDFLETAKQCWVKVCTSGKYTRYGGASIPVTGPSIDCSSFVSWVLYEYGYKDFKGGQQSTQTFYQTNWKNKYGWEEISVGSGQNPKDKLQPGDIFVRYSPGGTHHVTIVESIRNGRLYSYDCGNTSANWNGTSGASVEKTYFLTESGPGKIIRVTKPK